jgi:hypothetical protein
MAEKSPQNIDLGTNAACGTDREGVGRVGGNFSRFPKSTRINNIESSQLFIIPSHNLLTAVVSCNHGKQSIQEE